ncbi:MAG TPA: PhnD/SsuA/transferrin family substrate-binding protein [Vicinamibacterales bacterium]|nr:PhnD/SsuA/transferrin family substrate-binding protein [Vicinamibacterales bacterium]
MPLRHRAVVVAAAAVLSWIPALVGAEPDKPIAFLSVALDRDYANADAKLRDYLGTAVKRPLESPNPFGTYSDLIQALIARTEPYLARMTPYSYVAAEMLGARFDVLGTYDSRATGSTTYESYFVVNAAKYKARNLPQTPAGLHEYLKAARPDGPARFIYHDKFSTSSYLLPALWLRSNHAFAATQVSGEMTAIEVTKNASSSTELVQKVARDEADLAAVWSGAKVKFEPGGDMYGDYHDKVLFIQLPTPLPNDLLVSSGLDQRTRSQITAALERMPARGIDAGDFLQWRPIHTAPAALDALASLRILSAAPPAPVVVSITTKGAGAEPYLEDARQAVRLSGTELVLFVHGFHKQPDVRWTLERIHDGAIVLDSRIEGDNLDGLTQHFQLSFTSAPGDLTRRIVALIHSRMHRLRYIWPYQDDVPTVVRDVDFTVPEGTQLKLQRITWIDPKRNYFSQGRPFDAEVDKADPFKFTFRPQASLADFSNPLSNVAYRVILERRTDESTMSKALTVSFLGLLVLMSVGAGYDIWRRTRVMPLPQRRTLRDVCTMLAARHHGLWRGRTLNDADLLWCERSRIEELIQELKGKGLVSAQMGGITQLMYGFKIGATIPGLSSLLSGGLDIGKQVVLEINPERVGNTVRLDALLDILLRKGQMSTFVGRPLEWDALNDLVRGIIPGSDVRSGESIVRAEDETVIDIGSRHFNQVLDEGLKEMSFFRGTWSVTREERHLAQQQITLEGPLWIGERGRRVTRLLLEFNLPDEADLHLTDDPPTLDCWLVGKIVRRTYTDDGAGGALALHFRTLALLADVSGQREHTPADSDVHAAYRGDAVAGV